MIDTHAHLLMLDKSVIENMSADGLDKIVTISTTLEDSKANILLAQNYDNIYVAVGIYPEYATGVTKSDLIELENLAKQKKVVAIGEIGLDYHSEGYDETAQKTLFVEQLKLADKLGLPFCIHCRNAAADVYKILSENKNLIKHSGLMHCYSEGSEWVDKFLELGLYISFSGNITFKKSDRSFLKRMPLDKILIETDAPYLSPEPLRGQKNEPKNVRYVLKKLSEELSISEDELNKITTENAKRVYNIN